jgi:hypothetical protein
LKRTASIQELIIVAAIQVMTNVGIRCIKIHIIKASKAAKEMMELHGRQVYGRGLKKIGNLNFISYLLSGV